MRWRWDAVVVVIIRKIVRVSVDAVVDLDGLSVVVYKYVRNENEWLYSVKWRENTTSIIPNEHVVLSIRAHLCLMAASLLLSEQIFSFSSRDFMSETEVSRKPTERIIRTRKFTSHLICQIIGYFAYSQCASCWFTEKPYFSQQPEDVTVLVSEDASLLCDVRGMPPPEVSWFRQDSNMPSGGRTEPIDGGLKIKEARMEDEGIYFCQANNDLGSIRAAARLTVHCK